MTLIALLAAGFSLGFLASGHCLGMCGPIAFLIGSRQTGPSASFISRLSPFLLLGAGKALTYGWLGLAFGAAGHLLTRWSEWMGFAKFLPAVSGALMLYAGFSLAGWLPKMEWRLHILETKLMAAFESLKKRQGPMTLFAGGMLWGFLPCPMVLVPALASAVSGGAGGLSGAVRGFFMMVGFGLGTVPALAASGLGANYLLKNSRLKWKPEWTGFCLAGLGLSLLIFSIIHIFNHRSCH